MRVKEYAVYVRLWVLILEVDLKNLEGGNSGRYEKIKQEG